MSNDDTTVRVGGATFTNCRFEDGTPITRPEQITGEGTEGEAMNDDLETAWQCDICSYYLLSPDALARHRYEHIPELIHERDGARAEVARLQMKVATAESLARSVLRVAVGSPSSGGLPSGADTDA